LTVLEEFEPPKCCQPSCGLQNACFELLCATIHQQMTSVDEPGKKIIKKEALYFTYFARRSLTADCQKFWVTYSSHGRNQFCKVLS